VDAPCVVTVSVAVAELPLIVTDPVLPKLNPGCTLALAGEELSIAASVTAPVNPPCGVTVTVDVLPLAAPAFTVTAVAASAKLGSTELFTFTVAVPVADAKLASPL
jgi:hypothetical protein